MNHLWKMSSTEPNMAETEISVRPTAEGWHGVLGIDGPTTNGASVSAVRTGLAMQVKQAVQEWVDNDPSGVQINRIRLFTHLVTEHARAGAHQGAAIEVAAFADRTAEGWVARTLTGHLTASPEERERRLIMEILSGVPTSHVEAKAGTFMEAQAALVTMVMQELDFDSGPSTPDWSALRLIVTSRKTLELAALA
ncbi:hypothetical protein [Nocardiopsis sp. CNT312]|uniref:hypothetical protein n=1 Tax=Nocardiopsis sp. CNT312 TaxID=1137268 RepID=UPI00048C2684|nr:hypothetical protein [Nocardiopsis sp. CNT312]